MLGLFDATMLVVGGAIGSGIFITPHVVARQLDSPVEVLLAWTAGGAVALVGAFVYAELGQRVPRAGGQYVYLRQALHPLVGFLYGWALLLLIQTGAIAAAAIAFAEHASRLAGRTDVAPQPVAVLTIAVAAAINIVGIRMGSRVQSLLVLLKTAALVAIVVFAWMTPAPAEWLTLAREDADRSTTVVFGLALIPVLFTYAGAGNVNFVAGELRNPERDLPRSLVLGVIAVTAIYLCVNLAFLRALTLEGLAATTTPAAATAAAWLGTSGERFAAAAIAVSTFGFINLSMLAPTRVYYAMAADRGGLRGLARLHPRYQTPAVAIAVQSAGAVLLALTGRYGELLTTVVFADWTFFGLTVVTLFVFRRRYPAVGFRTPGYPWLPLVLVAVTAAVVISAISAAPGRSALGAAILLLGVPAYYLVGPRGGQPDARRRILHSRHTS